MTEEKNIFKAEIEAARQDMSQAIEEYGIEMLEIVRGLEKEISDWKEKYQRKVSELEQVTRERDALLDDLSNSADACVFCKKVNAACRAFEPCGECEFEWRGVPQEAENE